MLVDSHCHLHDPAFAGDLDAVLQRAKRAGVEIIVTVGTSLEESRAAVALAEQHESVYATVGIAPHDRQPFTAETLAELRQMARHPKVVAIGEFGLDHHHNTWPPARQREIAVQQLRLAADLTMPVVIHSRDAGDDLLAILREFAPAPLSGAMSGGEGSPVRGVMHCFSGTLEQAQQYAALGYMISIAGPITYPKPRALPAVAKALPPDWLLIETDAPFLAPQAYRGRRNEPAFVREVAAKVAEVRGESFEAVARATTENARRCFRLRLDHGERN